MGHHESLDAIERVYIHGIFDIGHVGSLMTAARPHQGLVRPRIVVEPGISMIRALSEAWSPDAEALID